MKNVIGCGLVVGLMSLPAVGGGVIVNPEIVGSHAPGTDIWSTYSVSVDGSRVYTSWLNAGVDIFDVSERDAPVHLSTAGVQVPGPYTLTWETDVFNGRGYTAVDGWGFQGIWIADVSDPSDVVTLGRFEIGGNRDMVAVEDILYTRYSAVLPMSTGNSLGFRSIDISDPSTPVLIHDFESPGTMSGLDAGVGFVLIADGEMGVGLYDTRDPSNPVEYDTWSDPGFYAQDVFNSQNGIFVSGGGELNAFDVVEDGLTGELSFVLLGTFAYPDPAEITQIFGNGLAVDGDFAYVMNGKEELLVIDVSDTSAMALAGSLMIEGGLVTDIAVRNDTVYLSDEVQGLLVVGVIECRADINSDGNLNFLDISAFLALYSAGSSCVDFNGNPDGSPDGYLNAADVSGFLAMYSAGCP